MSFQPFEFLNINNFFNFSSSSSSSSKLNNSDYAFEIVKILNEKELYSDDYYNYDEFEFRQSPIKYTYTVNIGYIGSKCMPKIKDNGCYIIMIKSQMEDGPNGIYCLSRSDKLKSGNINVLVQSIGKSGDKLEIKWNPLEYPCILLKHNFIKKQILKDDTTLRLGYNVKMFSCNF